MTCCLGNAISSAFTTRFKPLKKFFHDMTLIVMPQYKNCHAMDFLFGYSVHPVQIAGF